MLAVKTVIFLNILFGGVLSECKTCITIHADISLPVGATAVNMKAYENTHILNGTIAIENTLLRRFHLPHLSSISCTKRPCIVFRNNAKLTSIWLPSLKEIVYDEQPADVPVIKLQGEALEVTENDVEKFKHLSGGSLSIEDKVFVGKTEHKLDRNLAFLHSDTVLVMLCVAIVLCFISHLAISIKSFSREVHLKKQEIAMVKGMLEVRSVTMSAKTSRYLVEDYQKKNPTKNFGEALAVINKNVVASRQSLINRSRAALHEVINDVKKEN